MPSLRSGNRRFIALALVALGVGVFVVSRSNSSKAPTSAELSEMKRVLDREEQVLLEMRVFGARAKVDYVANECQYSGSTVLQRPARGFIWNVERPRQPAALRLVVKQLRRAGYRLERGVPPESGYSAPVLRRTLPDGRVLGVQFLAPWSEHPDLFGIDVSFVPDGGC